MSKNHSYQEIANDFNLWTEFVDPDATTTIEEFDSMSEEEKIQLQHDCFGADDTEAMAKFQSDLEVEYLQ